MENYKLGLRASILTIIINVLLAVVKIAAGVIGSSNAMLADGIHTLSDVLTTIVVLIGLKVASKEPDEEHPYGHEKYELIFAKILSLFLILTGIFIGYNGFRVLISGNIETPGKIALLAAFISILAKEFMFRYTSKVAKEIQSFSMEADAWHHRSDALSSAGTFVGILGARLGLSILDPLTAIGVSILIIKVGIDLYLSSIRGLVDESADEEVLEEIKKCILAVDEVKNIEDLKTRISGNKIYVDVDISLDPNITVEEGHDIAHRVNKRVTKNVKDVKYCMVHVEPHYSHEEEK